MSETYLAIQKEHLKAAWARGEDQLLEALPGERTGDCLRFNAFGEECELYSTTISLGGESTTGPEGILISLYSRYVRSEPPQLTPLQSFKELPHSGPYQAAFSARSEMVLVPHVVAIEKYRDRLVHRFGGTINADAPSGDFSFTLYPLPRIPLYYIFYLPDEEFPAAVTCLFVADATKHLPVDALADVAEYTAKRIIQLVQ
jgi:hypothetical protein